MGKKLFKSFLTPSMREMRVPRVYESAPDVYTWQNNYLSNSEPRVGEGSEFHAYTGARNTFIYGEIII